MAVIYSGRSQRAMTKAHNDMMKNLDKEIKNIQGKTLKGLQQAILKVKADAIPNTPKDTGALRNAMYIAWNDNGSFKFQGSESPGDDVKNIIMKNDNFIAVCIGNSQEYALYVHEMNKNYIVGGWKYITRAIQTNQSNIIKIIQKHAKV